MPFNITIQNAIAVTGIAEKLSSAQSNYASIENQLSSLKSDIGNLKSIIKLNPEFFDNATIANELGTVITKITNAEADLL